MIPLRHTLPRRTTPLATRAIIAANIVVFLVQVGLGSRAELLVSVFGFIPRRLVHPADFHYSLFEALVTLVSSLFLHGSLVHLAGNMIYLGVFGGAVEDALGHVRYLLFFVACGAVGSITHTLLFPSSILPSIGASGSIAGVLGAFLVLRPRARIVTLLPFVIYWTMTEFRAFVFLPIWFAMQFLNGFMALASARNAQEIAGIAWWAHVGGFLFGAGVGAWTRWRARSGYA